jgi:hypothetical protein
LLIAAGAANADERTEQQKQIDRSIVAALDFLAAEQQPNGAWRASYGEMTSTTSLGVMSFLAAGHVPGEGPYADVIDKGVRFVISKQERNGMLINRAAISHGPMYCHGISTLMLAEVAGMMPKDKAAPVRTALERAVKLIISAQNVRKGFRQAGGWRYQSTSSDSDLSVTGWQLMALRAAKNIGCDVPAENIDEAIAYVKACAAPGNRGFCYQPGSGPTAVRTGTGILALEICGEHHSPEALGGAEALRFNPLRWGNAYYYYGAYYCTLGMFQIGDEAWEDTRETIFEDLLTHQQPDGGWTPADGTEISAGRNYCTAMAVLALTVEYQYLPIYQR